MNESIVALSGLKEKITQALAKVKIPSSRKGEKHSMFRKDKFPELQDEKDQILVIEAELQEHILELRKVLKRPTLQFASVSGIDHLVEVKVADAKKAPADWPRINERASSDSIRPSSSSC